MIPLLWLHTLLFTQLAHGYDHSIELKRCAVDTACMVRESCITGNTDDKKLDFYKATDKWIRDNECDAVIQMKILADDVNKVHVMMEAKAKPGEKLKKDEGLKLEKDGKVQFQCKPGSSVLTNDAKTFTKLENKGAPAFMDERIFCSFTMELQLGTQFSFRTKPSSLTFTKESGIDEIVYSGSNMWMGISSFYACNHLKISSSSKQGSTEDIELTEMDTTLSTLTCPGKVVVEEGGSFTSVSRVICENKKWWKEKETGEKDPLSDAFSVYCPVKICSKCVEPPPLITDAKCTGICSKTDYVSGAKDGTTCPTLKCKTGKFTATGAAELDGEATCKRSVADPTKYAWFVQTTELREAACYVKKPVINCGDKYKPDSQMYSPDSYPTVVKQPQWTEGLGTNTLRCKNHWEKMLVLSTNWGDNFIEIEKLECNLETGLFRHNGKDLPYIEGVKKIQLMVDCSRGHPIPVDQFSKVVVPVLLTMFSVLVAFLILAIIMYFVYKPPRATASPSRKQSAVKSGNKSTSASAPISNKPGEAPDSDGKKKSSKRSKKDSKKSKKDKGIKLEDHMTWDNETFTKKILPNFKSCDAESKRKWLKHSLSRFYAYCNAKKTPESGTFNQFWLLVKQCCDDKCEDAVVWVELFNVCFLIGYSITNKNEHTDALRGLYMKPLESYMLEYLKKGDFYKRKDEPRAETEMRVICLMVLLHTRHPDVTETLRKLTYNEKLEVPLRMLTAACYTRERDDKGKTVQAQYKRVIDTSVLDPHAAEGWGTYLQHCTFGLGGYLITRTETFQYQFFDAIYQFPLQKDPNAERIFSPTDWLFAYKGAMLHENSAKIALDLFKKMNNGCLLHIDTLLKQKHKEDADEMEKARDQYKRDMKEYTMLLSEIVIGEEEFNDFKPHLHFVLLFIDDVAKAGEPLSEDKIREKAINMHNMLRDRNFVKECVESLKAIGAKDV